MRVFSYTTEKGNSQIGIEYDDRRLNFSQAWELYKQIKNKGRGPSLDFLQVMLEAEFFTLETFSEVMGTVAEHRPLTDLEIKESFTIQPPIGRPQKILCVGRNYTEHAQELGNEAPEEPIYFSKAPSALISHEQEVRYPENVGRVDFEGELAVVLSKRAKNVAKEKAMEHVAGYSILNDVTARDMQRQDIERGRPWFRSKSFDTFCPFGPNLVPKEAIKDPQALQLEVRVNGETKQQASTAQMLFDVDELVAYISQFCTLEAGDIIATGTPSGVGALKRGDVVECEVSEVGVLRNRVK